MCGGIYKLQAFPPSVTVLSTRVDPGGGHGRDVREGIGRTWNNSLSVENCFVLDRQN